MLPVALSHKFLRLFQIQATFWFGKHLGLLLLNLFDIILFLDTNVIFRFLIL